MSAFQFNQYDICLNPKEHIIFHRGRILLKVKTAIHKGKWTAGHNYSGHDHGSCGPVFKDCGEDEYNTETQAIISELNHILQKWSKSIEPACKAAAVQYIHSLNQLTLFQCD